MPVHWDDATDAILAGDLTGAFGYRTPAGGAWSRRSPRSACATASAAWPLPGGGRRAGLTGHSYRPQLIGLETRQHTGRLDGGRYAPHTEAGYRAPSNKTLLLLLNGLMAKRGVRAARKAAAAGAALALLLAATAGAAPRPTTLLSGGRSGRFRSPPARWSRAG